MKTCPECELRLSYDAFKYYKNKKKKIARTCRECTNRRLNGQPPLKVGALMKKLLNNEWRGQWLEV